MVLIGGGIAFMVIKKKEFDSALNIIFSKQKTDKTENKTLEISYTPLYNKM